MSRRLVALAAAAVLVLAACSEDMTMAQDFIKTWAADHALEIGAAAAGIPSGDPMVDAAVQGGGVVKSMVEADALVEEGWQTGDPAKMDQALTKRPRDWSIELSRANMALAKGDMPTYEKYLDASARDSSLPGTNAPYTQKTWFAQDYDGLVRAHDTIMSSPKTGLDAYASYLQCTTLYDRLARSTIDLGASERLKDLAKWQKMRGACEGIPH